MSNALIQGGAVPSGQSKWAPIFSNEFFSGLYTNRNPLRDPATPFLYNKFYSATRYEAIWDGENMEISPRLTLVRGPGHSVYNSQTFPGIVDYYSYHVTGSNIPNTIKVVADAKPDNTHLYGAVWDVTGPSTKSLIYSKSAGSGPVRFIDVGNILYMGDGVDNFEFITPSYKWFASTSFPTGAYVVDGNGFIQVALGYATPCSSIIISNGTLTATVASVANMAVGTTIQLFGMQSQFLNEASFVVNAFDPIGLSVSASIGSVDLGPEAEFSAFVVVPAINGTTSPSGVFWNDGFHGLTYDNNTTGDLLWQQRGPALRRWGVPQPTITATVSNAINSSIAASWTALTYYLTVRPVIVVGTSIYELTTAGQTAASAPSFTIPTVTDGTCVWSVVNGSVRQPSSSYDIRSVILVTWTTTTIIPGTPAGPVTFGTPPHDTGFTPPITQTVTYSCFFACTTPGATSPLADTQLPWSSSLGSTVTEPVAGGAVWTNIGNEVTRANTTTTSPVLVTDPASQPPTLIIKHLQPGVIGPNQLVEKVNLIVDSNGAVESVATSGLSSTVEPTWSKIVGVIFIDGGLMWVNLGSSPAVGGSAANTGFWVYTYAYVDEVTGAVGPAAPISAQIIQAADSFVQVQGAYTALNALPPALGLINIYRSTTNSVGPAFLIGQIPNVPGGGTWTYNDFSPDQGFPGSTMNNLIQADLVGFNSPPPAGFLPVCLHLSSIWGFVNNIMYYSAGGGVVNMQGGWEAFPPTNYITFQSTGKVGWGTGSGLYAILNDSLQLIAGTAAPFSVSKVVNIGIQSSKCFALNGQSPFLFTSDRQLIAIDPGAGIAVDGFPIADILAAAPFDPSTSYVTWHVDGTDQRLFISDGASGYYTMLNNIAPEPPSAVWSPKRAIVGGCSAIKSVETSPGNYKMLVGPATSGPILFRDITSATDNGTPYPAWAVLGSNVLCHPGQIAEIGFLHLEAVHVGTTPGVSVLMEEIYGEPGAPPFDALSRIEHDPPRLPRTVTLFSNRYYMTQAETPAWCRHLQMKISFTAEDALSEVYSFTVFGAIHLERAGTGTG